MEQFSSEQRREIRALAALVIEQHELARPVRRGRPPKSEAPAITHEATGHHWLPVGQLLASQEDVQKALQIGESKLDDLVTSGRLRPVRIDTCVRFDPRDVEALMEELYRERVISTRRGR